MSSISAASIRPAPQFIRQLAASLAAVVVFDAAWVRAPFLVMLGLPFIAAAWRYRQGRTTTNVALVAWCALFTAIGVSFALSNGLHAPAEANQASHAINPGDFALVYIGTPLAVWLASHLGRATIQRARISHGVAA